MKQAFVTTVNMAEVMPHVVKHQQFGSVPSVSGLI